MLSVLTICYETRIPVSNRCTKWDIKCHRCKFCKARFVFGDTKTLQLPRLTLNAGDSWAFVGSNGSGKSALARALSGELPLLKGERQSQFSHITRLSFEQLQKLVSDEWQRNNIDMLSPGEDDTGRTTAEIIQDEVKDTPRCMQLAQQFGITALLDRRFKYLSTGETRKPCCVRR